MQRRQKNLPSIEAVSTNGVHSKPLAVGHIAAERRGNTSVPSDPLGPAAFWRRSGRARSRLTCSTPACRPLSHHVERGTVGYALRTASPDTAVSSSPRGYFLHFFWRKGGAKHAYLATETQTAHGDPNRGNSAPLFRALVDKQLRLGSQFFLTDRKSSARAAGSLALRGRLLTVGTGWGRQQPPSYSLGPCMSRRSFSVNSLRTTSPARFCCRMRATLPPVA